MGAGNLAIRGLVVIGHLQQAMHLVVDAVTLLQKVSSVIPLVTMAGGIS